MWYAARAMSERERSVAIEVARAAGELLRREVHGARRIEYKGTITNLVTEMDARAEALIVDRLLGEFPDDAVLAEERGAQPGRSGRRWIIDPVDGTTNYAHGLPAYAVSIALERAGRVELGVIYDPSHEELYVAELGAGAFCNGTRLAVSSTTSLDESLLTTGFPYDIRVNPDNNLREYAVFATRSRAVRRFGSAVIDLAWVAAGRYDGFWELRLGPWDVAAGGLLVKEAGGRVTGITGAPLDLKTPTMVASNGRIHDAILTILREIRG
jgi:myo-inositol-1(or 4)-monophosphatase